MRGKVTLEEGFERAGMEEKSRKEALMYIVSSRREDYVRQISDIHDLRLKVSNENGVGYTVVQLTTTGIQAITDKAEAERIATLTNDWCASQLEGHRDRIGAWACLSMHDPVQASQELRRCVEELGFVGALTCNYQHAGEDGQSILFYDQPEYDVWKTVTELDVPFYMHPSAPTGVIFDKLYKDRPFLIGPPLSFANDVSLHVMGMISNGIFDRFPTLKLVMGHMGEHIPLDFWRIDHWFRDIKAPIAKDQGKVFCKHSIYHYFRNNIWITTSGHFSTITLKYIVDQIGPERVMFSIDHPYEKIEDGYQWWGNDKEAVVEAVGGIENYHKVGRDNAAKLLKLGSFYICDVPVE